MLRDNDRLNVPAPVLVHLIMLLKKAEILPGDTVARVIIKISREIRKTGSSFVLELIKDSESDDLLCRYQFDRPGVLRLSMPDIRVLGSL